MPRRYKPARRIPLPDPIHHDVNLAKFINYVMRRGKKSTAERIVYGALSIISERIKDEKAIDVFHKAIKRATPLVEVKARRVGGSTYQVPIEVRSDRGTSLASMWVIKYASQRHGAMDHKLAEELLACYRGEGPTIKKREDTHKMAEANKAFAHYRY